MKIGTDANLGRAEDLCFTPLLLRKALIGMFYLQIAFRSVPDMARDIKRFGFFYKDLVQ